MADLKCSANIERYAFLDGARRASKNFKVVPPDTGICHQVNLNTWRAWSSAKKQRTGRGSHSRIRSSAPDSHTHEVNGLGVFGWASRMRRRRPARPAALRCWFPRSLEFKLMAVCRRVPRLTDLVLTSRKCCRKKGVVGNSSSFYGTGLSRLTLPDRATIANMAPNTARPWDSSQWIPRRSPIFVSPLAPKSRSGSSRPTQKNRVCSAPNRRLIRYFPIASSSISQPSSPRWLAQASPGQRAAHAGKERHSNNRSPKRRAMRACKTKVIDSTSRWLCRDRRNHQLYQHFESLADARGGACSQRKAVERGLTSKPWVKTSFAPGSKVVTDYIEKAACGPR